MDNDGNTSLMNCTLSGNAEISFLLISESGSKNKKGSTALMMAASGGYENIVDLLIEKEHGI